MLRPTEGGLGLVNLRRRAEKLHGRFTIESSTVGGTLLTWEVPVGGDDGRRNAESVSRAD